MVNQLRVSGLFLCKLSRARCHSQTPTGVNRLTCVLQATESCDGLRKNILSQTHFSLLSGGGGGGGGGGGNQFSRLVRQQSCGDYCQYYPNTTISGRVYLQSAYLPGRAVSHLYLSVYMYVCAYICYMNYMYMNYGHTRYLRRRGV